MALHRAVHLARAHPSGRVLLATFSDTLASALHISLRRLIGNEPVIAERLEVHSMSAIGRRLYTANFGKPDVAVDNQVRALLDQAASDVGGHRFSTYFLWTEWRSVVDAWQLRSWEAYRDVPRLGRKTRLGEAQRALLWSIFSRVRSALAAQGLVTEPAMFARVSARLAEAKQTPFDFCVIDEAQDIGVAELRFLAALGGGRPNSLFLAGDLGQRIFQTPFSWRSLGVDVRGRSHTLRVNYRTSHQIRRQADRLLPPELSDVDGNPEQRRGTVSVFNGPAPEVRTFQSAREETSAIVEWLRARHAEAYAPHEIGVFVRSPAQAERAVEAVREAGLTPVELDRRPGGASGSVAVGTMHLAKGLEFRAVAVVACDDDVIPLQSRIETVADEADLEDVYARAGERGQAKISHHRRQPGHRRRAGGVGAQARARRGVHRAQPGADRQGRRRDGRRRPPRRRVAGRGQPAHRRGVRRSGWAASTCWPTTPRSAISPRSARSIWTVCGRCSTPTCSDWST